MKTFTELLEHVEYFEEGARDKAKEFKSKMKPLIKKVRTAQIGDPRRYAYMMVWPFLRDELQIPELQGQDTPVNSALIQRKLEELTDAGKLPDDAGEQFEKYAEKEFDDFVNRISATKRKTSLKSHYKGEDVKKHIDVAGRGSGFTSGETAAERAERKRLEDEMQQKAAEGDPDARLKQIGINLQEIEPEFQDAVRDISDTLQPSDTILVEIIFDPDDGPVVQKRGIIQLFQGQTTEEPDISDGNTKMTFEIAPDSSLAKKIKSAGTQAVETLLQDTIFDTMDGREARVIIHMPEDEDFIKPIQEPELDDTYIDDDEPSDDQLRAIEDEDEEGVPKAGSKNEEDAEMMSAYRSPYEQERQGGPQQSDTVASVRLPDGEYEVYFKGGRVFKIEGPDPDINTVAVTQKLKKGHKLKDALITSKNTNRRPVPMTDSVIHYMPDEGGTYEEPIVLETTRDRLKPKTNHQIQEYRRLLGE